MSDEINIGLADDEDQLLEGDANENFDDASDDLNGSSINGSKLDDSTASKENGDDAESNDAVDPELEAIKARVAEMEAEAEKLKQMQSEVMGPSTPMAKSNSSSTANQSLEAKIIVDKHSVYVGNVDYSSTAEELESHFHGCGPICRVTILCNPNGSPKGYAYVQFVEQDSVTAALALHDSLFKGRQIKVSEKRTNRPGMGAKAHFNLRGRSSGRGRGGFYRGFRRPRYRGRSMHYAPY